jgi:hypothetical protein
MFSFIRKDANILKNSKLNIIAAGFVTSSPFHYFPGAKHWAFNSSQFFTYDRDLMREYATRSGGGWWYPLANNSADSNT